MICERVQNIPAQVVSGMLSPYGRLGLSGSLALAAGRLRVIGTIAVQQLRIDANRPRFKFLDKTATHPLAAVLYSPDAQPAHP